MWWNLQPVLFIFVPLENQNLLLRHSLWCLKDPPPPHLFNQSDGSAHHTRMIPRLFFSSSSSSSKNGPLLAQQPPGSSSGEGVALKSAGAERTGPLRQQTSQTGLGIDTGKCAAWRQKLFSLPALSSNQPIRRPEQFDTNQPKPGRSVFSISARKSCFNWFVWHLERLATLAC